MKKYILIITILLLTGCLGEAGKGYITKTCTKTELINGNTLNKNISIKSKSGIVEQITIIETYDEKINLESITNSKKSEQNVYKTTNGITLDINNNIFTYVINIKDTTDFIKERFNIKEEQHKQIKYYEEEGFECK